MSYRMEFAGVFHLDRRLEPERCEYLYRFGRTRRMRRDAARCGRMPDPWREAVGLPIGPEGAYFVGLRDYDGDDSILDHEVPAGGNAIGIGGGASRD